MLIVGPSVDCEELVGILHRHRRSLVRQGGLELVVWFSPSVGEALGRGFNILQLTGPLAMGLRDDLDVFGPAPGSVRTFTFGPRLA
jgi:hypothetical protein